MSPIGFRNRICEAGNKRIAGQIGSAYPRELVVLGRREPDRSARGSLAHVLDRDDSDSFPLLTICFESGRVEWLFHLHR